ncbi:TPA: oligosaccharide flippase family protein, partial [Enterococcus faecium]|nr:oligosaccharide flippase family protein [Enterococcus faecium]
FPILTLNIVDAVMRFLMDKDKNKKNIASIAIKVIFLSVIVFGSVMYLLNITKLWQDVYGLEKYIFLYYISYVWNQFLIQFAKGLEKVKAMGIAGIISTIVTIIANIFFLLILKWGLIGFFIANILSQIISATYLSVLVRIWEYIDFEAKDPQLKREMLNYSIPLIATVVGWWINSTADRYVVSFIVGVSANGLLSVAYKIPQIINTLQGIFIQAWQISAIKEYGDNETAKFYGNTFVMINLLMCITCSSLIILTRPFSHILYAKDFYEAWKYVPFLLIANVLNCASGLLGPILSAKKDSKSMMWSAIIGALVNVIMSVVLVYKIGVQGATIATVICSYVIYVVRKRAVGKDIFIKHYHIVVESWGLLFVQAIIEIYFKNYVIEIIIMIILIIINISYIKQLCYRGRNIISMIKSREHKR